MQYIYRTLGIPYPFFINTFLGIIFDNSHLRPCRLFPKKSSSAGQVLSVQYFDPFKMHCSHFLVLGFFFAAPLVSAHGLIASATGDLGGNGTGLGVVSGGVNSEADVTIFKANAGAFGETTGVRYPISFSLQQYRTDCGHRAAR